MFINFGSIILEVIKKKRPAKRRKEKIFYQDQYYYRKWKKKRIKVGQPCKINHCTLKQQYVGIFIGSFLCDWGDWLMPAFYIQQIKKVVFGYQCFWCPLTQFNNKQENKK